LKLLKDQVQLRLSAVWSGIGQQTFVDKVTDEWRVGDDISGLVSVEWDAVVNICCNSGCSMSSVNIL